MEAVVVSISPALERPPWLRAPAPGAANYHDLHRLVDRLRLPTGRRTARCPNAAECCNQRTTTFFITASATPIADRSLCGLRHALPGRYTLASGIATTGALTRSLHEPIARDLLARQIPCSSHAYAALAQQPHRGPPGHMDLRVTP